METVLCPYCRRSNKIENNFCTRCGAKLNKENVSTPRLTMLLGDRQDAFFQLSKDVNTLGRGENNTIILNDSHISKEHATISFDGNEYLAEDRNSRNGVFVNGRKINMPERLFHGCLIRLGSTILRFEMAALI